MLRDFDIPCSVLPYGTVFPLADSTFGSDNDMPIRFSMVHLHEHSTIIDLLIIFMSFNCVPRKSATTNLVDVHILFKP